MRKYEQFSRQNTELGKSGSILDRADPASDEYPFLQSGIISKFCIQFDLAWKLLKELMEKEEGIPAAQSGSPKMILKSAFQMYPFLDEDVWLQMLNERNHIIYVYEEELDALVRRIRNIYVPAFQQLQDNLETVYGPIPND